MPAFRLRDQFRGVPQVVFAATNLKDLLLQFPAHPHFSRIGRITWEV